MMAERRSDGIITRWVAALLIISQNNHLHLYDIVENKKQQQQQQHQNSEEAFRALVPVVNVEDLMRSAGKGKKVKVMGSDKVQPSLSFDLTFSLAKLAATPAEASILVLSKAAGMSSFLKNYTRQQVSIRGSPNDVAKLVQTVCEIGKNGIAAAQAEGETFL